MRTIGTPSTQVRKLNAIASGTLPNGKPVVVNANGTVSVVAETSISQSIGTPVTYAGNSVDNGAAYDSSNNKVVIAYQNIANSNYGTVIVGTVSGNSISFGSAKVFEDASCSNCSVAFDSVAEKVVISYQNSGNSNRGTAIVGTVSGTNISFGGAAVFETGSSSLMSSVFDANAGKVVIAYQDFDNSSYGAAVVGTVSGTSISFGSPVVFESANTKYISAVFDSSSKKVVIAYRDNASTNPTAIVGTVSGTSISFGSASVIQSINGAWVSAAFDSSSNKVVVAYQNVSNSNFGTAAVGTVSGTSISFGSPVVFSSNGNTIRMDTVLDSTNNKIVIAYADRGHATLIVGTVSGSSISFGTPVVFDFDPEDFDGVFDTNAGKVVFAYRDNGNSSVGTAVVFQNASTSTNLTAENYVGLASNGYPNTAGATIDVKGAINNRQSGLTAGQSYFVQTNGTLTTTAGDPSVFAGTAVSATKIIVKG